MKLTQKQIFFFWLPLFASWLMMTMEGPITSATISRLPDSVDMLAAYGIVISLSVFIESPVINLLSTSTALVKDQASYRVGRRFTLILIAILTMVTFAIGFTPVFSVVIEGIMGVPESVARWVRPGMQIMLLFSAAIGWRRYQQGVLINLNQGHLIAKGTGVRLVVMVLTIVGLAVFSGLPGIHVGTWSVMSGIIAESAFITWFTRQGVADLPANRPGLPLTMSELFWFHLPLAGTSIMILLVQPLVSAALARMQNPTASLAAWPVLFQSMLIFRAPGLSLPEVIIAKTDGEGSWLPLRRFSLSMGLVMLGLTTLFIITPISRIYFTQTQGLNLQIVDLIQSALPWLLFFPALWVINAWLRGLLIRFKETKAVNASMMVNLLITMFVLGIGVAANAPGLSTAAAALMIATVGETVFQAWRMGELLEGGYRLLVGKV